MHASVGRLVRTYRDARPLATTRGRAALASLARASIADQAERLDWMSKLCLLWDLFEDILDPAVSLLYSKSRYDDAFPIQRRKTSGCMSHRRHHSL